MNHRHALLYAPLPVAFDNVPGVSLSADASAALAKRSPDSAAMLDYWDKTDAIVDGYKAVRDAGEAYLPKFSDEEQRDYDFRLKCTKFTNVYRDIVEGLSAKPFEQDVALVPEGEKPLPDELVQIMADVDGAGNQITQFASTTFFNGINSAIDWIMVDYPVAKPKVAGKPLSVAEQRASGVRPYWSHILGRNILEAKIEMIGGKETLTLVRILEPGSPDHIRRFERVADGVVTWELYEKKAGANATIAEYVLIDNGTVSIGVIPLVPFATGRRDGRTFRYFPAMQDAADLQIELYQQESGLKFAKILAAYPMLAGNGVKPPMGPDGKTPIKLAVGPGRVLYAPPDGNGNNGNWTYVEPSAQTLTFLAADVKATIEQLRELGRQPLTAQSGNLTVITTAVAAGKASSAVAAWGIALQNSLEAATIITCKWLNITDYTPAVSVYTDFDDFSEGKDLETLDSARERGDLSQDTYWHELKRRAVLSTDFNADTERELLLMETPGDGDDTNDDPDDET